ncbi:hypothetical protein KSP40_PGU010619 [Platanthera guangdongensis]|uniref:Uncharacterized protein n=1 Tax=Platanthera guangdongensis TaxID=2320717 RepID=A0ABR2LSK8_9ASPA
MNPSIHLLWKRKICKLQRSLLLINEILEILEEVEEIPGCCSRRRDNRRREEVYRAVQKNAAGAGGGAAGEVRPTWKAAGLRSCKKLRKLESKKEGEKKAGDTGGSDAGTGDKIPGMEIDRSSCGPPSIPKSSRTSTPAAVKSTGLSAPGFTIIL